MIFKLVYGELFESLRFDADASSLARAAEEGAAQLRKINDGLEETIRVSAQFTKQGIQVVGSIQKRTEAGKILTTTIEGTKNATDSLNKSMNVTRLTTKETVEEERKLEEQRKRLARINEEVARTNKEIALNRKEAARATTTRILGGTTAPTFKVSTEEARAFGNELGRLSELQQRFNLSQQRVLGIFQNVRRGGVNAYTGVERQVATASVNIIRAQQRLGTSAKREFGKLTAAVRKTKLKELEQQFGRVEKAGVQAAQNAEVSWRSFGRLIFVNVVSRAFGSFLNVFRESIGLAKEFTIRIAELRTISRSNQLTFEEWTAGVRELSEAFGLTAIDVAEGTYQILSNQVAEGAKAFEFQRTAALFARAAVASNAESVNLLTSAINAFGLQAEDANRVADIFFKTIELGRLRASDIAETFGRVGALANQLGVSLVEVNAAIATITIQGVRADEALTGIRNIFLKLIKPTDDMKKRFKEFGVESGDALIATFGFAGAIEKFAEILDREGTPAIGKLFGRIRAIIPILQLAGTGSERFAASMEEIANSAGAATAAAGEILRSIGARFERELEKIRNFFTIEVGQKLLKNILNITDSLGGMARMIKILTTITVAAVAIFVTIRLALFTWRLGVIAMTAATQGLAVAQAALNVLVSLNPYTAVAVAILAVSAILLTIIANTQSFEDQVKDSLPAVRAEFAEFFAAQIADAKRVEEVFSRGVENIFKGQLKIIAGIRSTLNATIKETDDALDKITKSIRTKFREVNSAFRSAINEAKRAGESASRAFDTSVRKTSEILFNQFKTGFDFSLEGLDDPAIVGRLREQISKLTDKLSDEFQFITRFDFPDIDRADFDKIANEVEARVEQLNKIRQNSSKQIKRLSESENKLLEKRNDIQGKFERKLRVAIDKAREARGNREKEKDIAKRIDRILEDRLRALGKINSQIQKNKTESAEARKIEVSLTEILERQNKLREQRLKLEKQIQDDAKRTKAEAAEEQAKLKENLTTFREAFRIFIELKPEKIFEKGFRAARDTVNDTTNQILENLKRLDPTKRTEFEIQVRIRQAKLLESIEQKQQNTTLKIQAEARQKEQEQFKKSINVINREREKLNKAITEAQTQAFAEFAKITENEGQAITTFFKARETGLRALLAAGREEILKEIKFLEEEAKKGAARPLFGFEIVGPGGIEREEARFADVEASKRFAKLLQDFLKSTKDTSAEITEIDTKLDSLAKKLGITTTPSKTLADNFKEARTAAEGILLAFIKIQKLANQIEINIPTGALPKQFGGIIPGTGNRDTVPAMLTPGEFVVNAGSTRKFFSQLVAMNRGVRPQGFQEGGVVNNVGDINVSVPQSVGVDGREIARVIKRELFRGSIRFQ